VHQKKHIMRVFQGELVGGGPFIAIEKAQIENCFAKHESTGTVVLCEFIQIARNRNELGAQCREFMFFKLWRC
jgi:hypothetical protein